jgi:hypothetical protein
MSLIRVPSTRVREQLIVGGMEGLEGTGKKHTLQYHINHVPDMTVF